MRSENWLFFFCVKKGSKAERRINRAARGRASRLKKPQVKTLKKLLEKKTKGHLLRPIW